MDQVQSDILRDTVLAEKRQQQFHEHSTYPPSKEYHSGVHAWVDARIESKFVPEAMRPHVTERGAKHHPTIKLENPSNETIPMALSPPGAQNEMIKPFSPHDFDFGIRVNHQETHPDFITEAWIPGDKMKKPRSLKTSGYYKDLLKTQDGKLTWGDQIPPREP